MSLSVQNLAFEYTKGTPVFEHLSFSIADCQTLALVGPSGSGKSTLLHCIAGLLSPLRGSVQVQGNEVLQLRPHLRNVGIMMQDQPLYEHMTVEQNIAFPLKTRGILRCIQEELEMLELDTIAQQVVSKCSGGERRRVAFGRSIVTKPAVLLLDEPFVSLQEELRKKIQVAIECTRCTTLLVTHDSKIANEFETIQLENGEWNNS